MYTFFKHLHSGLRWVLLIALIWAIYDAYIQWKKGGAMNKESLRPSLMAFIVTHTQLVFGLIMYFITPRVNFTPGWMKDGIMRFFGMEHPLMMLIAIVLISLGYIKGKKATTGTGFKTIFWYYFIALVLILATIPWPWMKYATGWI